MIAESLVALGVVIIAFDYTAENVDLKDITIWRKKIREWELEFAKKYDLDPRTIASAQFYVESRNGENERVRAGYLNPHDLRASISYDGLSYGVSQMIPSTARDIYAPFKSMNDDQIAVALNADPRLAIDLGCRYIKFCGDYLVTSAPITYNDLRFLQYRTMAYNQGIGRTRNVLLGAASNTAGGQDYWNKVNNRLQQLQA